MQRVLSTLSDTIEGELHFDKLHRSLYATDASVYRQLPVAVAFPKSVGDLQRLAAFASEKKTGLIPRTAGTSLAGQCVGEGIVVDTSRYMDKILSVDVENRAVTVQPGVIRDDLNRFLEPYGLFFGPNTSTANRCMIGGMVGNNSSGTTSIRYGVTRDKVREVEMVLSDGSVVTFGPVSKEEFFRKTGLDTLEGKIYRAVYENLSDESVRQRIREQYPRPEIHRRNTGYAIDKLIKSGVFEEGGGGDFNMCKLLAGSEGTLGLFTKITLGLDPLPPPHTRVVVAHFHSLHDCLQTVLPAMEHPLYTCELMDKTILDLTRNNLYYRRHRFFLQDDPRAILFLELRSDKNIELSKLTDKLLSDLENRGKGYAHPVLKGEEIAMSAELRAAGLGLLGSMPGDKKAVACVEDTAVALPDLPGYISEFTDIMDGHGQKAVYFAHAGAGELHVRPILNLKTSEDVGHFKEITSEVASLVKKYGGSLSGEHGDGRVRAPYIPKVLGKENYAVLKKIKRAFDPESIFNPGKITDPKSQDSDLRYHPDREEPQLGTMLKFDSEQGILRAVEQCNGSGDCRKPEAAGGVMCPSYRVTRDEKHTTRGRANLLRELLTQTNSFDHPELKEALDLCIGCKGCKSECPSNVDMAALKAEFEYQYHKKNSSSLRERMFANIHTFNRVGSKVKGLSNFLFSSKRPASAIKKLMGMAEQRTLPAFSKANFFGTLRKLQKTHPTPKRMVYFFLDEFTRHYDTDIGVDSLHLLYGLGYGVKVLPNKQSGRALISKGFLGQAKRFVNTNISLYKDIVSADTPLIGIEPSAVLTFRDEYLRLANDTAEAKQLSKNVFLIDEFLAGEIGQGRIGPERFTDDALEIKLHAHCHQKALSSVKCSFDLLNLPKNHKVTVIPSGCCGMAGAFGYEKQHYELSMKMGELSLFPAIRKASNKTVMAATGTSCRHQIQDGTGRGALHPITILRQALRTD